VTLRAPIPDDEFLSAVLARLDRKLDAADAERRRLIDLYQGGFIELPEMQRRATEVSSRRKELQHKRTSLAVERTALARDNQLRRRVHDFTGPPAPTGKPSPPRPVSTHDGLRSVGEHLRAVLPDAPCRPQGRPQTELAHPTAGLGTFPGHQRGRLHNIDKWLRFSRSFDGWRCRIEQRLVTADTCRTLVGRHRAGREVPNRRGSWTSARHRN
jgi:hypothetical protein